MTDGLARSDRFPALAASRIDVVSHEAPFVRRSSLVILSHRDPPTPRLRSLASVTRTPKQGSDHRDANTRRHEPPIKKYLARPSFDPSFPSFSGLTAANGNRAYGLLSVGVVPDNDRNEKARSRVRGQTGHRRAHPEILQAAS